VTARDIQVAVWREAIELADAEMLARGNPAGTRHGMIADGCGAVKRALEARLMALESEPIRDVAVAGGVIYVDAPEGQPWVCPDCHKTLAADCSIHQCNYRDHYSDPSGVLL
jgi:hypothetical protein